MINSLSESIVKNRTFTLMSCVAFVLAMAYGIPNIKIGNDFKTYFDVEYPPLVAYESIQEEFSESENILVAIEVLDGDIFERETLVAIDKMTEALWKTPHSVRVDSVTNFQNTFVMGDLLETEALFDHRENLSDESLVERKNIALSEQLLKSTLISPDGKATGISVSMSFPDERDYQSTIESVSYVRDLVETWEHDYPGLRFRLVGEPMLNIAFAETSAQDSMTLFPLMFGVILVFLGFTFRSIVGVVSTSIVIIFSVMAALGLVGWLGVRLTPDGISAVAMILPIAVADCVHIINTYLKGLSLGLKKIEAIRRSLTENMQAVALTTVTTGLGFLSLNFSESPPIQMMGTTVAFGVIVAGILSLTLLPVMLLWMPTKGVQKKESFRWLSRFGKFVIAKDRTLFNVIILITLVLGGVGVSMNKLDETILNYFSTDTQFRQDVDWVDENLTGVTRVEVLLKSHSEDGISSVAYLKHLDNFATWLRSRDEVVSVSVFSDIVKKLNQTMNQGDNGFYRIPASNVLASQYVLLYELSLPYGLGLTNQVNLGKTASRATIQLTKLSDQETIVFDQAVQNWLRDHTPKSMWSSVAGPSVMFAYQLESNVRSVLGGLVLVLVAISLILVVVLKSLKLGLISLVPNLIPTVMAFGIWGFLIGEIGLSMSVVMGMTLGIVVDDTLHFMLKYKRARTEGNMSTEDAIQHVFETVGSALFTTTFVLCVAFAMLAFSSFEPNANLGIMTSLTFCFALLVDFLFLPALLMRFDKTTAENTVDACVEKNDSELNIVN